MRKVKQGRPVRLWRVRRDGEASADALASREDVARPDAAATARSFRGSSMSEPAHRLCAEPARGSVVWAARHQASGTGARGSAARSSGTRRGTRSARGSQPVERDRRREAVSEATLVRSASARGPCPSWARSSRCRPPGGRARSCVPCGPSAPVCQPSICQPMGSKITMPWSRQAGARRAFRVLPGPRALSSSVTMQPVSRVLSRNTANRPATSAGFSAAALAFLRRRPVLRSPPGRSRRA